MTYWTTEERRKAFDLRRAGKTVAEIAVALNRSLCSTKYAFIGRNPSRERKKADEQKSDIYATELLRVATITAIARHANSKSICIDAAARELLSGVAA